MGPYSFIRDSTTSFNEISIHSGEIMQFKLASFIAVAATTLCGVVNAQDLSELEWCPMAQLQYESNKFGCTYTLSVYHTRRSIYAVSHNANQSSSFTTLYSNATCICSNYDIMYYFQVDMRYDCMIAQTIDDVARWD